MNKGIDVAPSALPRVWEAAAGRCRSDVQYFPASFSQERWWCHEQNFPGDFRNVIDLVWRINGDLDPDALENAMAQVVARHEALRTTFIVHSGSVTQVVSRNVAVPFTRWLISPRKLHSERQQEVRGRIAAAAGAKFDLQHGPLVRTYLIGLSPREWLLLVMVHHIAFDSRSMEVLTRDLFSFYRSLTSEAPVDLPALSIQYADYAVWERNRLVGPRLEHKLSFWLDHLADAPLEMEWPTDQHAERPKAPFPAATARFAFKDGSVERLRSLCSRYGVTPFMALRAVLDVLLYARSGQTDLVVGTPTANRRAVGTNDLVGTFSNALALRNRFSADCVFSDVLMGVRKMALSAFSQDDLPIGLLASKLFPDGASPSPVCSALRRYPYNVAFHVVRASRPRPPTPRLTVTYPSELLPERNHILAHFVFLVVLSDDGVILEISYRTDLFDHETISELGRGYERLLELAAARNCVVTELAGKGFG